MQIPKRAVSVALLAVVASTLVAAALLWSDGYRLYALRTGSMAPTYPSGTLVIDAPMHRLPHVGQVITFETLNGLVTHRVHARTAGGLTTKGDANRSPDAWTVRPAHVVGRVDRAIPGGGYVLVFFQQPTGVLSLVVLAVGVMFAWTLFFPAPRPDEEARAAAPRAPHPLPAGP